MHTGTAELFKIFEYLGEIKNEFENSLAFLSWAQMGLNHEKIGDRKSRDTLPLSSLKLRHFYLNPYR